MFVILTYDVNQKRVGKILKICRKYLNHVQKSVFEGMITEGRLTELKHELSEQIDSQTDSISIYELPTLKYMKKEQIGIVETFDNII